MIFTYRKWEQFCRNISEKGVFSITARQVAEGKSEEPYLVLKHDVETDVGRAFALAQIEQKYGHKGSYYVQAYLLNDDKNIQLLQEMQKMGHEISYHHDVMDSCKGCMEKARQEFAINAELFRKNGFRIITVCQHGNPVIERVGYTSNRDFFRNKSVQKEYPDVSDIMVNFGEKANTEYVYYSDAGRKFKMIYDPLNNDVVDSEDKNVSFEDLDEILKNMKLLSENSIISIHPHRWTKTEFSYMVKASVFKYIKAVAKIFMKVPVLKKLMSRYYHLAKRI